MSSELGRDVVSMVRAARTALETVDWEAALGRELAGDETHALGATIDRAARRMARAVRPLTPEQRDELTPP